MILKVLYDYYERKNLPAYGLEEKEISYLIVINKENGSFMRLESLEKGTKYLVPRLPKRTSGIKAGYLWDNGMYVLGLYEGNERNKAINRREAFINNVERMVEKCKECKDEISGGSGSEEYNGLLEKLEAVKNFYNGEEYNNIEWDEDKKNSAIKSNFSFLIDGDEEIVPASKNLIKLISEEEEGEDGGAGVCLVTGNIGKIVRLNRATPIPGGQTNATLVSFNNSAFCSYGHERCANAPISKEAEFKYSTALNDLIRSKSNKRILNSRTCLFWGSSDREKGCEEGVMKMFGGADNENDPRKVWEVFNKIFKSDNVNGLSEDKFYFLSLAPNGGRIYVTYWAEISPKDLASNILRHIDDMKMDDGKKSNNGYYNVGLDHILSAISLKGEEKNVAPNISDAVVRSIFEGLPYPNALFQACIRRMRAERSAENFQCKLRLRVAIIKAYLNRLNKEENFKLSYTMQENNTNIGYLCGRLFAVIEKIQKDAIDKTTIRDRYISVAATSPTTVFPTILRLSLKHLTSLEKGKQKYYEKIKGNILDKLGGAEFPRTLNLNDQGRFFVGYYQQQQDLYAHKKDELVDNND